MNKNVNPNLCFARKNQKKDFLIQCPCPKKNNTDFCGKHKNYLAKKLIPINKPIPKRIYKTSECETTKPIEDKIKSPKLSKKNHKYIIKPYEYHAICKSTLTIIDYLYDKDLKFGDPFIKRSYKYYELHKYHKNKLKHRFKDSEEKKAHMKNIKKRLQNFFESFLTATIYIEKIIFLQRKIKAYLEDKKFRLHGPAVRDRKLCNNPTDFYSFDSLDEIERKYFFSYKDEDGFIYGFHIESFINLISNDTEPFNPYNRIKINKVHKDNAIKIWQDLQKRKQTSNYTNNNVVKDLKKRMRDKCLTILQKIDMFGYQTKIDWIMELPISRIRQLFRSIKNYWDYKAGLTQAVKDKICPNGNPFHSVNSRRVNNINRYIVIEVVLNVMDLIVSEGLTEDDKNQGCILILFSINEINRECGRCNPWLV